MTKKELHAALDLHAKIQRLRARLSDLGYVNCKAPEVRVQGGCAVSAGQIAAELSGEITELEKKLEFEQEYIRRHLDKCQLNEIERKLMVLRYVRCFSWGQVCDATGYVDRHIYRIHKGAVNKSVGVS